MVEMEAKGIMKVIFAGKNILEGCSRERQRMAVLCKTISIMVFLIFFAATVDMEAQQHRALKDAFADRFLIGAALNESQVRSRNEQLHSLIRREFNNVVAENCMKLERLQPQEGIFMFEEADRLVEFAEANRQIVTGHCLVWHSQVPDWFFKNSEGEYVDRETLINRMRSHIYAVVGHFRGKVKGWDVVNEAVEGDGTFRKSPFYNIIGEDFIRLAFQFAHEADPDAELYYNDYGMDSPKKRDAVCALVRALRQNGCRIDAVGMQSHVSFDTPLDEYETSIKAFALEGVKVMITELDLSVLPWPKGNWGAAIETNFHYTDDMDPYSDGLTVEMEKKQTDFYCQLFDIYNRNSDVISRVCFWGVCDGDSWKNNWPIPGRTDYPLAFDRCLNPKPFVYKICNSGFTKE